MEGTEGSRGYNGGGLPRHSFVEDPFFRGGGMPTSDMFRDFDGPSHRRGFSGSNPRLFDDDFFDNFSRGEATPFGAEPSFFRSSLPRRSPASMNGDARFERPIHVQRQQTVPQRSPSQSRQADPPPIPLSQNGQFPPQQNNHQFHHPRQSSSGGGYDSFPSTNRTGSQPPRAHPQYYQPQNGAPNVHTVHVQHDKQPREHHASNGNIVEINNADPNAYTNGKLNPDKRRRFSNVPDAPNSPPKIPVVCVEDYGNRVDADNNTRHLRNKSHESESGPAISETPIPLPPPVSMANAAAPTKAGNASAEEVKAGEVHSQRPSISEVVNDIALNDDYHDEVPQRSSPPSSADKSEGGALRKAVDVAGAVAAAKPSSFVPMAACNEQLIHLLDDTERRVEQLRECASQLEQEKESLLDILNNIKINAEILRLGQGEQDDFNLTADRLLTRCKAVDVVVNTPRNDEQTRALVEVNALIDAVIVKMHENIVSTKEKVERFLNACSPDEPPGPIDQRFQTRIVECTADDQKKVRRRLAQLIEQIQRAERNCPSAV